MPDVRVEALDQDADPLSFKVTVGVSGDETSHTVTISRDDLDRLTREDEPAEAFIARCFDFLLDREPKEAIMSAFDVSVISTYFPEFEEEIAP